MTDAIAFYQLLTTVSFTLLGLWFVVLGLDPRWRQARARHRAALHTVLCFLLPGVMGLGSVLASGHPLVWRTFFVLGGVVGLAESLRYVTAPLQRLGGTARVLAVVSPVAYALVVAAALLPAPLAGLVPLQVEGLATGLVFIVGLASFWLGLTGVGEGHTEGGGTERAATPPRPAPPQGPAAPRPSPR